MTAVVVFLVFCLLLAIMAALRMFTTDHFTMKSSYDIDYNVMTVPVDFYQTPGSDANLLPKTHYAAEFNDRFFMDAFEIDKKRTIDEVQRIPEGKGEPVTDKGVITRLLQGVNAHILNVLNRKLDSNEKYMFNMVYAKVVEVMTWKDKGMFLLYTKHVVHRDTKVYGVSFSLYTLLDSKYFASGITQETITTTIPHNVPINPLGNGSSIGTGTGTGACHIIGYKVEGYIFEDKLSEYTPMNLEDEIYAPAT